MDDLDKIAPLPTASDIDAGLEDARATLAELFRRYDDAAGCARCLRALKAVVAAERTMRAADAFVAATTATDRRRALERLRATCSWRIRGGSDG